MIKYLEAILKSNFDISVILSAAKNLFRSFGYRLRMTSISIVLRQLPVILSFLLFAYINSAFGAEPSPQSKNSIRSGLDILYFQGPSQERDSRYSYLLGYQRNLLPYLRLEGLFFITPDSEKRSGKVEVSEDFYTLAPTVSIFYVYLFRYTASLAPTFSYCRTKYQFEGDEESFSFYEYGIMNRFNLEYAFNSIFEVSVSLGHHYRIVDEKWDWMYGLSGVFYL